jgi:D-3-phosphoglycerate dehydrogenase
MPDVLITTEALREKPGPHLDILTDAGFSARYPKKLLLQTEEDTLEALDGYVAVIAGSEPYTERVLSGLPQLRVISRNGVGYDCIEVPAATRRGVAVAITPEGNHQAVAEHALSLMLAVARGIVRGAVDTRQGHWRRRSVAIPLRDRTLGIVGLGRIGRSVARRAAAFGMRLIACDEQPNREFADEHQVELVDFNTLLSRADFVTLHAPMTDRTRHMIKRESLARMKRGSVLINTARGGLIDENDLFDALQSGQLAGAGLDVLAVEPPPADHPLLALDNVIVTPHVAAFDASALEDMAIAAARNIVDLFAGRWPAASIVNPDVKPAWIG